MPLSILRPVFSALFLKIIHFFPNSWKNNETVRKRGVTPTVMGWIKRLFSAIPGSILPDCWLRPELQHAGDANETRFMHRPNRRVMDGRPICLKKNAELFSLSPSEGCNYVVVVFFFCIREWTFLLCCDCEGRFDWNRANGCGRLMKRYWNNDWAITSFSLIW